MNLKRSWTEEDDKLVRDLAQSLSIQRLAVRLKRTNSAIIARAKILGVEVERARRLPFLERVDFPTKPQRRA